MLGKIFRALLVLALLLGAVMLALKVLYRLPSSESRVESAAMPASAATALGRAFLPTVAEHPGTSGIYPLLGGRDAFAARVLLARDAEESIDAQYYIWQDDLTGIRLLSELRAAAERGVRVRLLVDDNGTPALDAELVALDALPTAEVRYYNPFVMRAPRAFNYVFDVLRLNRRMHNKSFTIDGIATIVGGRNIGDVYFETGAGHIYFDLDVLAFGPAAADVAADFDRYWNSSSAYPASLLIDPAPGGLDQLAARDAALSASPQGAAYAEEVLSTPLAEGLRNGGLALEWVPVQLFSDDPAKTVARMDGGDLMVAQLMQAIGTPRSSVDLVSAYFIPGDAGVAALAAFVRAGARVRTLTNALEATDVVPVHSGYARYRGALVDAGVEVHELRAEGGDRRSLDELGLSSLSEAALHAKSLMVDRERVFIGSFNFDPRSVQLNTEMGLLIDSPTLAARMTDGLDAELPRLSYLVDRGDSGKLEWSTEVMGGATEIFDVEPNSTLPLRAMVKLISWLPVEWLL